MDSVLFQKEEFLTRLFETIKPIDHTAWPHFFSAFFEGAPAQTFQKSKRADYVKFVTRAWEFYKIQNISDKAVQINYWYNPKRNRVSTVLCQKDEPFILQTLKAALSSLVPSKQFDHELEDDAILFHPILHIQRNKEGALIAIVNKDDPNYGTSSQESLVFWDMHWAFGEESLQNFLKALTWRMELLHLAVGDWPKMRRIIQTSIPKTVYPDFEYFEWLVQDNFLFLGLRTFELSQEKGFFSPKMDGSLGIFKDNGIALNKNLFPVTFSQKKNGPLFCVTKTHIRSPIHSPARVDMIELIDQEKNVMHQIIGTFTMRSYKISNFEIPMIRAKAERIFKSSGLKLTSHDGKKLFMALGAIPHDEYWHLADTVIKKACSLLIHFSPSSLPISIHQLSQDRSTATLIVFLGRERYGIPFRDNAGSFLEKKLKGVVTSTHGIVDDLPFARIIYVLDQIQNSQGFDNVDEGLQDLSLNWHEKRHKLFLEIEKTDPFVRTFSDEYAKDFSPQEAVPDGKLLKLLSKTNPVQVRCFFSERDLDEIFHSHIEIRITSIESPIVLSHLLGVLRNYGFIIHQEKTYALEQGRFYLHHCLGEVNFKRVYSKNILLSFERTLTKTLTGHFPDDDFNQLLLAASYSVQEIGLIRSYGEYMQQLGYGYTPSFMAESFAEFPKIARLLCDYFLERFDPSSQRRDSSNGYLHFEKQLKAVRAASTDQFFRDMRDLITATVRTNYFMKKDYLSFKFESALIPRLIEPRPLFEIYVSSLSMQGIHLRSSKIARGGIRYSDRPQDFRSEVLQLMQAQDLKNSIIVPTGAKGGFIVKTKNPSSETVLEAYKMFIQGLLDLTDNFVASGEISTPNEVVAYDDSDPYFVVAPDKGTATFSDMANILSERYHFWMGDAFASGGSKGYNHKKLGVTAKGAFISIHHHFKKLGIDIQEVPVRVIGIGDMSGDVFGNGMLMYPMCLIGAFNHLYIFVDPSPDPMVSYEERNRLFELSGSSWTDYNPKLLSKGGAIYARESKILHLSPEIQKLFSLPIETSPNRLIQALLGYPCDLLWFGGIGTYVQGNVEQFKGDPHNDNVRIRAKDVKAKVIGEGANLGITPLGRIDLGLQGVLLNSDAIDNSGGVNCSDREVNLKILLHDFNSIQRDEIITSLAPDIVILILQDNKSQNINIDSFEKDAAKNHENYCTLLLRLEEWIGIKRDTLFLESDMQLRHRSHLTRPEFAIILSLSEVFLKKIILDNHFLFTQRMEEEIEYYFPKSLFLHEHAPAKSHLLYKELGSLMLAKALIREKGLLWMNHLQSENLSVSLQQLIGEEK